MKTYIVDVVLNDRFTVDADSVDDAVAEAVSRAVSHAGGLSIEATVLETRDGDGEGE